MMGKVFAPAASAVADIPDHASLAVGGLPDGGTPRGTPDAGRSGPANGRESTADENVPRPPLVELAGRFGVA
jgi:hypothetical protein